MKLTQNYEEWKRTNRNAIHILIRTLKVHTYILSTWNKQFEQSQDK